ncbi:MAG TPA: TonB-dependent receptor [Acidobacteriota bacterium]|nr:TonB-dependent receptor [Acidobacteriota bacterium]
MTSNREPARLSLMLALGVVTLAAPAVSAQEPQEEQAPPEQRVEQTITVTATRRPFDLEEISAHATVINADQLRQRPALGLDEALRWAPQFSLLRRSPGRTAHPTAQGLNLRGVSPSGTSRALVLLDGLPLTDAFGGWVYWSRTPSLLIERVEMVLGGASGAFGNQALAGTLQIVSRTPPARHSIQVHGQGGSQSTFRGGFAVSAGDSQRGLILAADAFDTRGYIAVTEADRGPVDEKVTSSHQTAMLRASLAPGLLARVEAFHESRDNGTPETYNSTRALGLSVSYEGGTATNGHRFAAFTRRQEFRSRFSSVIASRSRELAVLDQEVPSWETGIAANGWRQYGDGVVLGAGLDWRRVGGVSREDVLLAGFSRDPGGTQNVGGLFVSAQAPVGDSWHLEGSLRGDGWHNNPRDARAESRSQSTVSSRAGVVFSPRGDWRLRAAAYRSFRAPTLNELYRAFRVGNVSTSANDELNEERLTGAEIGGDWSSGSATAGGRFRIGITGYWNRLRDAVVNATVGATPTLVLRQRRNLGAATVRGIEIDASLRRGGFAANLVTSLIDTRVDQDIAISGQPLVSLVGNRLPQVPEYRLRGSLAWTADQWGAMVGLHVTGDQFEDDLNALPLASGSSLDAALDWHVSDQLTLGLRGQNLLDERLEVRRTSILLVGPPRSLTVTFDLRPDRNVAAATIER